MFKILILVKLLTELLKGISASFHSTTANNHVLVGHVFKQLHARDWFNCIQACHDEARCISYNYDESARENGLCELNNAGLDDLCDEDKSLVYSMGFVFQQLREEKVSLSILFLLFRNLASPDVFIVIFSVAMKVRKIILKNYSRLVK